MANNHNGQISKGKEIIHQFYEVTKDFPQFTFAFKFQRRELDSFLHKDYQDRLDIPYIKRFVENQMSAEGLLELKNYAKSLGFLTVCTPFDEAAVDTVKKIGFDYLKIGSCSITDWALLNKIAEVNMPVIGSVGGTELSEIHKVVDFFKNRQLPFILMYCVGLYPTENDQLCLDKLDILKQEFPDISIGFSTHEHPDNFDAVKLAIAKGINIFEKHVDLEQNNAYSITPIWFRKYLEEAVKAQEMCKSGPISGAELSKLRTLQRGAYLKRDVIEGEIITRDDLYFAFPIQQEDQLAAHDCSKYTTFKAKYNMWTDMPLDFADVDIIDNSSYITQIRMTIKNLLEKSNIVYPIHSLMEISHHYGLDKFYQYGMCIITLVNNTYCKKLLAILPGQKNPEHFHKKKQETFFTLCGEATIIVNGVEHKLSKGNIITINPNEVHSISSVGGAVIEELSSTHYKDDSFYLDKQITNNSNRKTSIYI